MRCLVVSDLHYALPQFDWLTSVAPRYDLIVFAGDALDVGSMVDFSAQTLVVQKYLQRVADKTQLIFCSGNHDLDFRSESGEKVARWIERLHKLGIACDGDALVIGDTLYSVFPWWDGPSVKERLIAQLSADATRRATRRWIWAHHAPPRDSQTSWSGKQSFGDTELTDWIAQYSPDVVISGHVHQSPFVENGSWADRVGSTWIFNSGRQYGSPPAYIVIDTAIGEALWISAMGAQSVRLDAPLPRPIPSLHALPNWFEPAP
ncbi:metallophosphoesterase [Methylocystis sp. H62]|uniref:metallophosphoesterase family protein n=1 Tax=Methylocystis sp. H62 TaxID=2785789 RepID=UPI0018C2625E|nr:metallophosphoesterase family protein [Methylocystis sp. H62]MBG0792669.1 metallophosphoesterase [Methylocystis sp. H62]